MRRSSFDHNAKLIMNGKSEINTTKNRTKGPAKMKISKKAQKMLIGANGQPTNFGDQAASADQKLKIVESSSPTTELLPSLWSGKNRDEEKLTLSTSSSSNLPLTNAGDSSTTKSNSGSPNLSTAFPMNDEDILAVGTQMEDGDKLLSKLKRFLKTVYYFSKNLLPKQHDSVKELILKVIGEEIDEQTFYEKLYESTRFPLRPYVVPFMKASLPLLRKEYEEAAEDIMESMLFFDSNKTEDRLTNFLPNDQLSLVNTNNSSTDNLNSNKMVAHSTKKSKDKDQQQLYQQQQQQQQLILANSNGTLMGQFPANQTFQLAQSPLTLNVQPSNVIQCSSKRTNNGDIILRSTPECSNTGNIGSQMPQASKTVSFNNAPTDMDVLQQLMPSTFGSTNINGSGSGLVAGQTYGAAKHNAGSAGAPQLVSSNNTSSAMQQPLHLFNIASATSNNASNVSTAMTSPKMDGDSAGSLLKMGNNKTELMSPNDEHWAQVETLFSNMTSTLDKLRHAMLSVHQRAKLAQLWGEKCQQQSQQRQREQSDQKIAQLKQKADAVVNEVKSAAVAELQRAVLAAEQKAAVAIANEKAKMEKMLAESRVQEDSVENCWNCGRKAGQTCSGCGCARYCGVFCQHKDWNRHRVDCGKMAQATAATSPTTTVNGGTEIPTSTIQPSASTSSLLLSPKSTSNNQGTTATHTAISKPQLSGATRHSPSTAAAAALIEFRKFFQVDPQHDVKDQEENNVTSANGETEESPWKRNRIPSDRAAARSV